MTDTVLPMMWMLSIMWECKPRIKHYVSTRMLQFFLENIGRTSSVINSNEYYKLTATEHKRNGTCRQACLRSCDSTRHSGATGTHCGQMGGSCRYGSARALFAVRSLNIKLMHHHCDIWCDPEV